jgi:hypothetical protein
MLWRLNEIDRASALRYRDKAWHEYITRLEIQLNACRLLALAAVFLGASLILGVSYVRSQPIEFEYRGHASGTIGGVPFDSDYRVVAMGRTSDRVFVSWPSESFYIDHTSVTMSLAGLGDIAFVTPTRTWVSNFIGNAGISHVGQFGANLITGPIQTPAFRTWDMLSSLSEQVGLGGIDQPSIYPVQTSAGALVMTPSSLVPVSFAARLVPEPTAALIGCFALAFMLTTRLPKRRRNASCG